jgi:hypothetical protein
MSTFKIKDILVYITSRLMIKPSHSLNNNAIDIWKEHTHFVHTKKLLENF